MTEPERDVLLTLGVVLALLAGGLAALLWAVIVCAVVDAGRKLWKALWRSR